MIRPAKEAFQDSEHRLAHENLVKTKGFQTACDYALLAFVEEQPAPADPAKGWDAHSQTVGARRVLEILKTIATVPKQQEQVKTPGLNYKAKV